MARSLQERLRALHASVGGPGSVRTPDDQENGGGLGVTQSPAEHERADAPAPGPGPGQSGPFDSQASVARPGEQASERKSGSSGPSVEQEPASETWQTETWKTETWQTETWQTEAFRDEGFVEVTQGVWHREIRYDILTRHGDLRFADMAFADLGTLHRLAKLPDTASLAVERLRFYDTETTGLGTGAGTFPFLHAVGQFEDDEFVVHQYFLADYSGESELLEILQTCHFTDGTPIVSFNGKSFDWPLLVSRLTLHRVKPPLVYHLDLLYPSRRLWRQTLQRVSLGSVESYALGLERTDDLPGKEAPLRYFEFVADGDLSGLVPVFHHNATDVCSLVTLACRLAEIVRGTTGVDAASEWTALGRIYDEWNESNLAAHCFHEAITRPDVSWRELWFHSLHCKRQGDIQTAVTAWLEMAQRYPWSVLPCVELAKAYEHRCGELVEAMRWTREAKLRTIRYAPTKGRGEAGVDNRILSALEHRLQRITRKLSARGDASASAAAHT